MPADPASPRESGRGWSCPCPAVRPPARPARAPPAGDGPRGRAAPGRRRALWRRRRRHAGRPPLRARALGTRRTGARADAGHASPGALGVPVEEVPREIRATKTLEIHREERDVAQHVAEAEMIVELEAVEHSRTAGQAEDVVGEQVAMPVARLDRRRCAPRRVARGRRDSAAPSPRPRRPPPGRARIPRAVRARRDCAPRARADRASRAPSIWGPVPAPRWKRASRSATSRRRGRPRRPRGERREPAVVGHPPHLDEMVDGCARCVVERNHAEVDVGREPPVERHLALALPPAARLGGEVDEGELDRLLELPHQVGAQPQDRDVRLPELRLTAGIAAPEPRPERGPLVGDARVGHRSGPDLPVHQVEHTTGRGREARVVTDGEHGAAARQP